MKDFLLERLKAVAAIVTPMIGAAIIKGVEAGTGFDIPTDWELAFISFLTGIVVHQTPNKSPSQ